MQCAKLWLGSTVQFYFGHRTTRISYFGRRTIRVVVNGGGGGGGRQQVRDDDRQAWISPPRGSAQWENWSQWVSFHIWCPQRRGGANLQTNIKYILGSKGEGSKNPKQIRTSYVEAPRQLENETNKRRLGVAQKKRRAPSILTCMRVWERVNPRYVLHSANKTLLDTERRADNSSISR